MPTRTARCVAFALVLGAVAVAAPGWSVAATPASPPSAPGGTSVQDPARPADVERVVAGDMVVDWIDAAAGGGALLPSPGVPAELTVGPADTDAHAGGQDPRAAHAAARADGGADVTEHHADAGGGYALFSPTARWLPGGYAIRLTGADGRIEQYRRELTEAARAATAATGVPIRIVAAPGGPVAPGRGEIAVVLGSGPCGSGSVGCGGPALTDREVVSGRVWIHPSGLGISPAQRANLAAHELGHALGLQHFDGSWTDGRQVMYPVLTGATSYRAGDGAGLRRVAGIDDRPAGTVASRDYAAGRVHVTGTVSSGSRVRISAGSIVADVAAGGGRFSGSLPLPAGSHVVCATSLDPAPGFRPDLGCGPVDAPGAPVGHLGDLQGSATGIQVRGWALDPQTAGPVDVQITRNGVLVATVRADEHRDDLGAAAHRYGTDHGFDAGITPEPGRNHVCVRIVGVGAGGDAGAGCADIEHEPAGDALGAGAGGSLPRSPGVPIQETAASAIAVVEQVLPAVVAASAAPVSLTSGLRDAVAGR